MLRQEHGQSPAFHRLRAYFVRVQDIILVDRVINRNKIVFFLESEYSLGQ